MKQKLNRVFALALAVILTFSLLPVTTQAAGSFRDVSPSAWYAEAVEDVCARGWMAGEGGSVFNPNGEVTRGMFVTVLARAAGAEVDNNDPWFDDTAAGKWYTGAAAWAAREGLVSGVGGNRFAPNKTITRQDMATVLNLFLRKQGYRLTGSAQTEFYDVMTCASYARTGVETCAANGLISGFPDGSFGPRQTATRAQLAVILKRLGALADESAALAAANPEQHFESEEQNGLTVKVDAPTYALPADTAMTVTPIIDENVISSYVDRFECDVFAAIDIMFTNNGAEIEPNEKIHVQIKAEGLSELANPALLHIRDDGSIEFVKIDILNSTRGIGGESIEFDSDSFSGYVIVNMVDWNDKYFFVVHTASGLIDTVKITSDNQEFDLTSNLTEGTIYGGYYENYGGYDYQAVETFVNTSGNLQWASSSALYNTTAYVTQIPTDSFVRYTGESDTYNSVRFFNKSEAITDVKGSELKAHVTYNNEYGDHYDIEGKVFYIKEVPSSYLQNRYAAVKNSASEIRDMFFMTVLDDLCYTSAGFDIDGATAASQYPAFTLKVNNASTTIATYTPANINSNGFSKGLLWVAQLGSLANGAATITAKPYWTTLDGEKIYHCVNNVRTYTVDSAHTAVSENYRYLTGETMYFNLDIYLDDDTRWYQYTSCHYVYFKAAGDDRTLDHVIHITEFDPSHHIYSCQAPVGYYSHVVVLRLKSDYDGSGNIWQSTSNGGVYWNKTFDIPIDKNNYKNWLDVFSNEGWFDNNYSWNHYEPSSGS